MSYKIIKKNIFVQTSSHRIYYRRSRFNCPSLDSIRNGISVENHLKRRKNHPNPNNKHRRYCLIKKRLSDKILKTCIYMFRKAIGMVIG